jgi:hypothetical protein
MTTSAHNAARTLKLSGRAVSVQVAADELQVRLEDGRRIMVPVAWFPRLAAATAEQANHWELTGRGIGIYWPDIDEDILVEHLLGTEGELLQYRNGYDPRAEITDPGGGSPPRAEPEQGDQTPSKGAEQRSHGRDSLEQREFI